MKDKSPIAKVFGPVLSEKEAAGFVEAIIDDFVKKHHEPPRCSFYIFSRLRWNGADAMLASPAGMWGALTLDQALEAATRQYKPGTKVFLRLDFVLPPPPDKP